MVDLIDAVSSDPYTDERPTDDQSGTSPEP